MWQERPALHDNVRVVHTLRSAIAPLVCGFSRPLLLLERALLLIGVILLGWYALAQFQIAYDQALGSRELEEIHMSAPGSASGATHSSRRLSLATGAVVGRVDIPRIGVSAVVREGDDVTTLRRAVGHIPGTALPGETGNAALAGHRDTFFRGLRDIRNGDQVTLSTPAGTARYLVRSTRVVDPSEVSVLAPTYGSTLTLVTCYPFNYIGAAPKRFIVRAEIAN